MQSKDFTNLRLGPLKGGSNFACNTQRGAGVMSKNANVSAMRGNSYNQDYLGKIEKDQLSIMSMKNLENVID